MNKFETLLAAYLSALAGCTGVLEPKDPCEDAPEDDGSVDEGVVRSVGYVAVEPGGACPAVEDVADLGHEVCCPARIFAGTVCAEAGRRDAQVSGYNGYYDNYSTATDTGTGTSEVVDLCLYEGLFEVSGTCCGRPLLQGGAPVVAALARTEQWSGRAAPQTEGLSEGERAERGERWLRAAMLEHASVASFARFTLDLLRFGAPPDLLAGAQQAALDEVEHARLCFAIASAYLGTPVGPAEMALGGSVGLSETLSAFVEALVREGCVGETLSVFEAAERLPLEGDPAVRAALERIIEDESRHASLAWSALRWALQQQPDLAGEVARVFAEEHARAGEVAERGWRSVIAPALSGLAA